MRKIYFAILGFLLASCSSNGPTATTVPNLLPTSSPIPTQTVLPPTPTLITATQSPAWTSTPLWTPLPTLASPTAQETLSLWVQGQFDCLLPCWGGITPGETSWHEARQVIDQLSGFANINSSENRSCDFGACSGVAWSLYPNTLAEGVFYSKLPENTIHVIQINIQNEGDSQKINLLRDIGLQEAFNWYGLPPIFLITIETDSKENRFMKLVLVYPERQSIIRYTKKTELVDGKLTNCGADQQIEMIILDNKEQLASLDIIATGVETRDLQLDARYRTVEEATGISPNTFYNAITSFSDFCISTPVDMWTP